MQLTNMRVTDFARQAADGYLENGGDLNKAVAKLAKDNELTPMQIQRVVEAANHEVNARQYKTAEDKRFVFELASRDKVMELLGTKEAESVKTAAADVESFYVLERDRRQPPHTKIASTDDAARSKEGLYTRMNDVSAGRDAALHMLERCYAKLSEYSRDVRAEKLAVDLRRNENFTKFVKEAQRLMLEENIPFHFMFSGSPGLIHPEVKEAIFKDAHAQLTKRANSVEKALLAKFDPKASKEMGMEVVNGNQPLFIHLRATAGDAINSFGVGCVSDAVNNCLAGVVTAIHQLNSDKDVKRYIEQEVQPFANNVQRGVKYAMAYVREHANDNTWLAKTANWSGVVSMLDKIGRIFQLINQGGQAAESAGGNMSRYVRDLMSPAFVEGGQIINSTGLSKAK